MLLQYLLENIDKKVNGELNKEIKKIEYDSKKIGKGDLFVAIKGYKTDGHQYIMEAIKAGAVAIIADSTEVQEVEKQDIPEGVTLVFVDNTRRVLAQISAKFFDMPSNKLKIIGVTGTKGKTTTAYMVRDILLKAGKPCGLVGTIANTYGNVIIDATRTSPESLDLHKLLKDMVDAGMEYVVMEVSSHALELERVHGIKFEIGVFTNLSKEHLDFHENMDNYLRAKAKLFAQCNFGIINSDDIYTPKLMKLINCKTAKYGIDNATNVTATDIRINNNYVDFKMYINKQLQTITVSIPGKYTVYNALAAIAVTSMLGVQMEDILGALAVIKVPGRSEIVDIGKSFAVIIDYAHTPSSLEAIILNTKKYIKGRVITVFGCGGNRDKTKRPDMGKIAGTYSDFTVITTDNPRDEEPKAIAKDIEEGIKETKGLYKTILNRNEAIAFAMRIAWKNDTVIIAGKGHETYQELKNGKKVHMDDRETVKKIAEGMPEKNDIKL
ncbi:MAG: UDP-N-acetylmuramoyl-L-alanyl-D-glutamate--2,6-diaminopimelate ligase [Clostridia bacterium]|nr:UDP-N-acetylmuramoyl-L-alanyl-D-glutamate--2,6-diaminopimelate ligase [Clostridia bacterium]